MASNIVVLGGSGVMFNYNLGVAQLYKEVLGKDAKQVMPGAFNVKNEYDLVSEKMTAGSFDEHLHSLFTKRKLWSRLPVIEGVKEAIDVIVAKGYEVVCLTSMPPVLKSQRMDNAKLHGLNISKVIAVDRSIAIAKAQGVNNPKLKYIADYEPYAFIDDMLKNFLDMEEIKKNGNTRMIWIDNSYTDDPNAEYDKNMVHEKINNLMEFANSLPQFKEEIELEVKSNKSVNVLI